MGFLDSLLGTSKESQPSGKGTPFSIATSFKPMRLSARSDNSVELVVEVKNTSDQPQLCSILAEVPKGIGFDGVALHKTKEIRIGQLPPHEAKLVPIGLHGSSQTPPGLYRIQLTVYSHYRDYSHVLDSSSKSAELRVV
jgi:hypothetical protein